MTKKWQGILEKISDLKWKLPQSYFKEMRVPGIIYANEKLLEHIFADQSLNQVANVACLPGIVKYSLSMPDIHSGYGFPIGGVAAISMENGVISPGGVGYDINCGMRLLKTNLELKDVKEKIENLTRILFQEIPCGIGTKGKIKLSDKEITEVMIKGAKYLVNKGYGWKEDLELTEENGFMPGADPDKISKRAKERGLLQIGTLGAGNHFVEIQVVEKIYDQEAARVMGLFENQITIMIHSGSRGFGYQICDDYLKIMNQKISQYNIHLPDRQLACAPIKSKDGQDYFKAMVAAANYAWANRQALMFWIREVFEKFFNQAAERLEMHLVYDVSHNIAKIENHLVEGVEKELCVHRKGATRAFGPNHSEIPERYKNIGQPVILPGSMGTASYVLLGTNKAMEETFGSTCHGAGRVLSRHEAKKKIKGRDLQGKLKNQGIITLATSLADLGEEAPEAYKDVDEVVKVVDETGIAKKVAKMRPLGVIKG